MEKGPRVRGLLFALTLWLGLAGSAMAQTPTGKTIDLQAFRARVAEEIRRQAPDAKVILLSTNGLRVVLPGEPPKDQSMERGFSLYQQEPERLDEFVKSYARSFLPIPVRAEALRVLVRTDAANPQPDETDSGRGLTRPIAGGLIAIVALDGPDAFEFARAARLRSALKMDDAAIWKRALANTRAQIPYEPKPLKSGEPVGIESGKGLASSLLVDDGFWNSSVMIAQGPIVVALAGRDEVYLAKLGDTRLIAAFKGQLANNAGSVLFPQLLVRRGGRWEVLP